METFHRMGLEWASHSERKRRDLESVASDGERCEPTVYGKCGQQQRRGHDEDLQEYRRATELRR